MSDAAARPFIFVLAGVNGAGKSSVAGAMLNEHGLSWFNPDTHARQLRAQLGIDPTEANSRAWEFGRTQLVAAIANGTNYAFETTLGGATITSLLAQASRTHRIVMLFCGLASIDMHIQRVKSRVANGGHDIPEHKIRERWVTSRLNLIELLPVLARLQVFDNSTQVGLGEEIPSPLLTLEVHEGQLVFPESTNLAALKAIPYWARPIFQACLALPRQS